MNRFAALSSIALAATITAFAQPDPQTSARSASGQFYVSGQPVNLGILAPELATNNSVIVLEPTLVTVSSERTRQAVWRLLDFEGTWEQPVAISLYPARSLNDEINIITECSGTHRSYRVELPSAITGERYLRALTQVILLEFAGRDAANQAVDIPAWLTEGIAFHLLCNHSPELLLGKPRRKEGGLPLNRLAIEYRQISPLEKAHKILLGDTAMTFEELSWPGPNETGANRARFQASAQLFVSCLLKLPGGYTAMRNFLSSLPKHQNWQLAFLQAFNSQFQRPLDIEKWWTLEGMSFAGRDLTQTWPYEESCTKLSSALIETVDVYTSTNDLPKRTQIPLTDMVREWRTDQRELLTRKSAELRLLHQRIAPELEPLTADYIGAIDAFLNQRNNIAASPGASRLTVGVERLSRQKLLRRLTELDKEFDRLAAKPAPPSNPSNPNRTVQDLLEMRLPPSRLRAN